MNQKKMKTMNFKSYSYVVNGVTGFTFDEAIPLWRTKYETPRHFRREIVTHPALEFLGEFMDENWEQIQPVTVQQAFEQKNMERRRTYFNCIGVTALFKSLDPLLIDRQVVPKVRHRWDQENKPWESKFEDIYELYEIDLQKMFGDLLNSNRNAVTGSAYAVRCWCTTTNREYWIYVDRTAALGSQFLSQKNDQPDAIRAIAWTIRLNVTEPKRLFRQGDIIVAEMGPDSEITDRPYHLDKERYLNLMYSET